MAHLVTNLQGAQLSVTHSASNSYGLPRCGAEWITQGKGTWNVLKDHSNLLRKHAHYRRDGLETPNSGLTQQKTQASERQTPVTRAGSPCHRDAALPTGHPHPRRHTHPSTGVHCGPLSAQAGRSDSCPHSLVFPPFCKHPRWGQGRGGGRMVPIPNGKLQQCKIAITCTPA